MSTHSCPLGFSAATPKRSKCRRFCPLLIPLMLKACVHKNPLKSRCLSSLMILHHILCDLSDSLSQSSNSQSYGMALYGGMHNVANVAVEGL